MAASVLNFDTGPATLPDVGDLVYNGCKFSPLFTTTLSGTAVKDVAKRTVKMMEYILEVDGYVTSPDNPQLTGVSNTMKNMEKLLTAQGGTLTYEGRGFDLSVNAAGAANFNGSARDVAWGPTPELLEFQPLGGGRSAKVRWRVTLHLVVTAAQPAATRKLAGPVIPLLQFNCETSVTYGEDYFAKMSIRGTMEVPLTRLTQGDHTLKSTVDDARDQLDSRIFNGIDLSRFYVANRQYNISRDKRTLEFDIVVEEKPYMDQPQDCSIARGTFSFRPARAGMGLCLWLCTLRCTYTVRSDRPRRTAWLAFLALLRERMNASSLGNIPQLGGNPNPAPGIINRAFVGGLPNIGPGVLGLNAWLQILRGQKKEGNKPITAWLIDFSGDEGVYRDSKTVSFSATWRLNTTFSHILVASGLWRKIPEKNAQGGNLWAISMKDVSGSKTWVNTQLDPAADVIVDFGSQ